MNHFNGQKFVPILNDLELFKEIINDSKKLKKINVDINDKEYIEELRNYIENYEDILRSKKSRKRKKNSPIWIIANYILNRFIIFKISYFIK